MSGEVPPHGRQGEDGGSDPRQGAGSAPTPSPAQPTVWFGNNAIGGEPQPPTSWPQQPGPQPTGTQQPQAQPNWPQPGAQSAWPSQFPMISPRKNAICF